MHLAWFQDAGQPNEHGNLIRMKSYEQYIAAFEGPHFRTCVDISRLDNKNGYYGVVLNVHLP